jgi:hypothetical protein
MRWTTPITITDELQPLKTDANAWPFRFERFGFGNVGQILPVTLTNSATDQPMTGKTFDASGAAFGAHRKP